LDDEIKITLTGTRQELNKISPESLKLSVDVGGFRKGSIRGPLTWFIPDTVNLSGSYDVKISVKKTEVKFNEVQMKLIVRNLKLSLDEDIDALKNLFVKKLKLVKRTLRISG